MALRPRFTIRTLAVIVTLVCAYAACWGPTKKWGVDDVAEQALPSPGRPQPKAPLLVEVSFAVVEHPLGGNQQVSTNRRYYFWFFGYVVKLPYERRTEHVIRVHGGV